MYHRVMRVVAFLMVAACGAEPKQPFLANAPHPDTAAVAAGAAATAAAITLVDPDAATRGKPEKASPDVEKKPVEVKQSVPSDVFDRLDHPAASSGSAAPAPEVKPAAKTTKRKGPPPHIPLPSEAVKPAD
jgi:hypothetical protein